MLYGQLEIVLPGTFWTGYFALAAFETVAGNTVSQSCSVDSITNLLNPFGTPLLSEEVISSAIARRSLPESATVSKAASAQ